MGYCPVFLPQCELDLIVSVGHDTSEMSQKDTFIVWPFFRYENKKSSFVLYW